jgi:cytoskeletal protein RodZ
VEDEKQNDKPVSPAPVIPKAQERPTESRLNRFLVRALRWLVGILIVMGLGALLVIFTLYRPMQLRLGESQVQGEQADQRIADLESQIESLSTFEAQNKDLKAELDKSELHIAILSARADVATAQLALTKNDDAKARLALSKTPETLKKLGNLLDADKKKVATDMQARLDLAVKGIGVNAYAAASDLDVLATALIELENAYFAKP